jgi:lipase chaperone LimK
LLLELDANKPVIKQKLWKTYVYYIAELELLLELDANKPVIKQKLWKKHVYYIEELELLLELDANKPVIKQKLWKNDHEYIIIPLPTKLRRDIVTLPSFRPSFRNIL